MIKKIKLVNFRNFQTREFFFSDEKNFIIGENGRGKTNILEALSLLTSNTITGIHFENLVNNNSDFFHIEMENHRSDVLNIFYNKKTNKKKYAINSKTTTKKKFQEISLTSVTFSPILMNMMYLSPSLRRDFLDNILSSSFPEYSSILKNYKKSLLQRNRILKNIGNQKSDISEITFWDNLFIKNCTEVYKYRILIKQFLEEESKSLLSDSFSGKVDSVDFKYISSLHFEKDIAIQIKNYLEQNIQRDIILKTTNIGPHRDDFNLLIDNRVSLVNFASRGEVKTTILGLKNLEIKFIENQTQRKPVLIVDDLFSELDKNHKEYLINNLSGYQTFISGINLGENSVDSLIEL